MISTGLEFANGTTDDCKQLVTKLFQPAELLAWYKSGRRTYRTGDLVIVTDASDAGGAQVWPRAKYVEQLRVGMGRNAEKVIPSLTMATQSAHQVVALPTDSDAFWLVLVAPQQVPIMVVLYASPYEELDRGAPAPLIGGA